MSEHAIGNAKGWLETMREMVAALGAAEESGDNSAIDEAQTAIHESPLSVMVRDDWRAPGAERSGAAAEYEILLSTGGPALRIYGGLDGDAPGDDPQLQWQDWGTPWTSLPLDEAEHETVCKFAAQFYYGEG